MPDEALAEGLPGATVVNNNLADSERMDQTGVRGIVDRRLAALGVPVINPPEAVATTARVACAARLRGIEGLLVPHIRLFDLRQAEGEAILRQIGGGIRVLGHPAAARCAPELWLPAEG